MNDTGTSENRPDFQDSSSTESAANENAKKAASLTDDI